MTYHKKEWTAFTEADLLGAGSGNGHSIGRGDSFTMPGSATVTMSTYDNDRSLSGDNWNNEHANDYSGQYARVDGARVGSQMYAESYHVLHGSDGNTYYLIEIEVEGYNAPGIGDDFFTFYGAVPPAGVELSVAGTCNVRGCWVDYSCLGAGDTAPANTPPHFTNLPENGIICVDENTTFVIDSDATDADGDALTYEIVGGRDADFFEIDAHTGELSFIGAPDYENPQSGGNNNTYDVTIKVSDDKGGSDTKALWVKVKDVDETDPDCIVIEAEDMHEWGFKTVHGSQASGGKLVKLACAGGNGDLWTTFNGMSGEYDLTVRAQDESDGQSVLMVKVNGHVVGTIKLDRDSDGGGSDHGGFSNFTLENIQINQGDTVSIWADGKHGEYVRIDKIELCKDGEPCPDGFSLEDFSGVGKGTVVGTQFDGFSVVAQRSGDAADSENDAMIFDSNHPTGGDHDLEYSNLGNIIIISEDNDSHDPDDNAHGGSITFDFDNPSDVHDIKLLDIEESGGTIDLFDADGTLIKSVDIPAAGDNSIQTIKLDAVDVGSMVINLVGSGAVDDLCFKPGDEPLPGSLSGRYFIDENNNDVDDGEPGVEGVIVELLDADGTPTGTTTTTAADGSYSFGNLPAGTYGVKFTDGVSGLTLVDANQGGDDTIDSDATDIGGGMSTISNIVVVAGADTPDNDAGVEDPGTAALSGRYFCDENDNDVDDGEPGISGALVTLLDAAGNPATDGAGNVITTTTDSTGNYSFTGLLAGTYGVLFAAEATGKEFVAQDDPNNNGDDTNDSDVNADGIIAGITLAVGETSEDNDAGVEDPGTASIGDKVFLDANGNGIQDAGEVGVEGVGVTLLTDFGTVAGNATTDANGMYRFDNLDAGGYFVAFDIEDTFVFTDPDQGGDDAADSDANPFNGLTGLYTLGIGEENLTVDAGVISANEDPVPQDDMGKTCADEELTIDVLDNDIDPENDPLTITMVDGQAINEGNPVTTGAGTIVSLVGGELVFDGEAAYAALDIGEEAVEEITYTVSDGNGGTGTATVDVTFCGDANSVESLVDSFPSGDITYQVQSSNIVLPVEDYAFNVVISGTGDGRLDDQIILEAYCLDRGDPVARAEQFADAPLNTGVIIGSNEANAEDVFDADQVSAFNGQSAADNLDLINYILNQDHENNGFTGWEVQRAVWELTNDDDLAFLDGVDPGFGSDANVDLILADAAALGEGFVAGVGDVVGLIIDPGDADPANTQPFIVAVNFEDYDCIC